MTDKAAVLAAVSEALDKFPPDTRWDELREHLLAALWITDVGTLSECFDVSERHIHALVRRGVLFPPVAHGVYLLGQQVQRYIQHVQDLRYERGS
jgi:hypothetical protein